MLTDEYNLAALRRQPAHKFQCKHGHTFIKTLVELENMKDFNGEAGDLEGCWCTKCDKMFNDAKRIAVKSNFIIVGNLYDDIPFFHCVRRLHRIALPKHIPEVMQCKECHREDLDEEKRAWDTW